MHLTNKPAAPGFTIFSQWFISSLEHDAIWIMVIARDVQLSTNKQIKSYLVSRLFSPRQGINLQYRRHATLRPVIQKNTLEYINLAFNLGD